MRQMNRGRLNLSPPAGLDVTWARRMCPHCEDRSANYLAPLGAEKEEREREEEEEGSFLRTTYGERDKRRGSDC